MRRKENEITDRAEIEEIIARADVCRLGLCDGDRPYVLPLCFGYEAGVVYFHCAAEGTKLDLIARNPNACVEWAIDTEMVVSDTACKCSVRYRSVIAFGRASVVTDPDAKRRALDVLMSRYTDGAFDYPEKSLARTAVIRVDVESMTGKRSSG